MACSIGEDAAARLANSNPGWTSLYSTIGDLAKAVRRGPKAKISDLNYLKNCLKAGGNKLSLIHRTIL